MSIDAYACSGLVLRVTAETIDALCLTPKSVIDAVLETYDHLNEEGLEIWQSKSVEEIFEEMYNDDLRTISIPVPGTQLKVTVNVYSHFDGDSSSCDEMEDGYYLFFLEEQLYMKQLGPIGQALEHRNVLPEFKAWVQYG